MSKKELDQAAIIKSLKEKLINQKKAAKILNLSVRQIRRKLKNYLKSGDSSFQHKNKGKISNRKIKKEIQDKIITQLKSKYEGFGPTLAAEKLKENHNIIIDHETLRKLMIEFKLYIPKKRKHNVKIRREPKHHEGEMVQLDGSYHIWFGDEYSTLIVFIDDATKKIFCRFAPESTKGVTETFALFLKKYGRPIKLYTDYGKVFSVNAKGMKNRKTQFSRMLEELNISITYANSPQAKGRVERVNRTLQDRLVKELKLLNITNIEDANAMLDEFTENFNQKFSVESKSSTSLYRSVENYNLHNILCSKYKRILNNDHTITFKNQCFQLNRKQSVMLKPKNIIEIYKAFDGTISLWKSGVQLSYTEIKLTQPKEKPHIEKKFDKRGFSRKPKSNHPWKNMSKQNLESKVEQKADISNELKRGHF